MEPLYKVGDKVQVIVRTAEPRDYKFTFVDSMTKYTGKIVTIASVCPSVCPSTQPSGTIKDDGCRYQIVEDSGRYNWASSMFLPLTSIMSQSSDTSTTIKIKVKTNQIKFNFKN